MADTSKKRTSTMGVSSTPKPVFNRKLFDSATIGELKTRGAISDNSPAEIEILALEEIVELFSIDNGGADIEVLFTNAVEAVQAVGSFITDTGYVYTPPKKYEVASFSVTVTVPTGSPNATVAFTVNGIVGDRKSVV